MFFPSGSDYRFAEPSTAEGANWVSGNREKTLFAVISRSTIYIYQANPQILLSTFRRNEDEIEERGEYVKCIWRHDSGALCILTTKLCVYVYVISISDDNEPFTLIDQTQDDSDDSKLTQAYLLRQQHPNVSVNLSVLAKIGSKATCAASLKDDLFVCLEDGWVHRITWNGEVRQELSFNIKNVPLSADQVNARYSKLGDSEIYITDIVYCPLIGGLGVVLSDGRAALIASQNYRFEPQTIAGIWISGLNDAVCCAANHKFRLLYFGCKNGDVAAYHLDDTNGAMTQTFRIKLSIKDGTEYLSYIGRVKQIHCLPQGLVFGVTWDFNVHQENGKTDNSVNEKLYPPPALALFSPFGSQWWCSLEDPANRLCKKIVPFTCIEWGAEGFQLWSTNSEGLSLTNLSRAISINQPSMECVDRIALISADSVLLSPSREKEKLATAPHCFWNTYSPPQEYISVNWPLRYAAVDEECSKHLIVSGTRGFAHLNLKTNKWRLFRNETQEQSLLVTGGVAVFQEHLLVVGCDLSRQEEGIFVYAMNKQIDNNTSTHFPIPSRSMVINLRNDHLLTFDVASVVTIYVIRQLPKKNSKDDFDVTIERCAEIRIHELLPHPTCVISMQLTALNYHSEAAAFCHGMDSLLVNVSGHLLLLSPFHKEASAESNEEDLFQLHQPMLIASNVERVWIHSGNREIPHLNKALWINAGAKNMKVWLPLFHTDAYESGSLNKNKRSFISRRIMLPVDLNLYPIAIGQDCLAVGVESQPNSTPSSSDLKTTPLLVHNVIRNSEVFIHRLLRQLLKRNLGVYALEIATSCRSLPYFSHILELLLHDVLDEEATSSEPIPDPLLPRVVAFIHEFPEYLETIVHCARKTELAFWNLLFSVSHHPRDLFKMCLKEDQLDTATSCLIILQSMESTIASVQHATVLLEEALNKRRWLIARDIVRFLNSIDGVDLDEIPETPLYQKLATKSNKQRVIPNNISEDYNLVFNSISVETHGPRPKLSLSQQSSGHSPPQLHLNGINGGQSNHHVGSPTTAASPDSSMFMSSFSAFSLSNHTVPNGHGRILIPNHIASILEKHAEVLIEDYALRDLGAFASHLDFDLVEFMKRKNGGFCCEPEDFPTALMKLHSQFKWPYPVVGDVVDKLIQRISTGDVTPSASEDETPTSPGAPVVRRRSSSRPSFDWKIFEKLCHRSSATKSPVEPSEPELKYMIGWMAKSNSLEWIYLLSLMHRDLSALHAIIENNLAEKKKVSQFLKKVSPGTEKLLQWARQNCPAYVSILKLFANFLEHTNDQQKIRKFAKVSTTSSSASISSTTSSSTAIIPNGTIPKLNGSLKTLP
uniref:Protein RIC1 homolog n=1 Tax=Panagrolaimus superbus TaxID=310955 RepID=A0A914ZAQ3_9BILA